jgi:nickel transport protein
MATAALILSAAQAADAHQLNVFASTDCATVLIEAKFSTGRVPVKGDVRVLDGNNTLLRTDKIGEDGTLSLPLADLDASTGLLIEVDTGDHDDYWILTPEDITRKCQS